MPGWGLAFALLQLLAALAAGLPNNPSIKMKKITANQIIVTIFGFILLELIALLIIGYYSIKIKSSHVGIINGLLFFAMFITLYRKHNNRKQ
jgi:uncharacterized membrane protein YiaA